MSGLLNNKICIITGSTRGIGKEIALLFAQEGAEVVVNGSTLGSADDWINNSIQKERLHPYYFDITDTKAIHNCIMDVKKKYGHIDVLVNNAAVEFNELIGMISYENMMKMFKVNVFGTIEMIQAVSRVMSRNANGGSIINISSMVGLRGNPGQLVYSATKGAVIAITKSAAKELACKGIRVNSIAPGLTQTEMMEQADFEKLQGRIKNICMGRIAQPKDIAGGCLLLASDYAEYISGQVLPVDGCTII
ncbi:SDR family NAD(P)-dependent oxidoreductase [Ruminococcus albus]|uniref:3-oxoacyl-[acyl-carrier protein] reductase n=1 Tax=Ruminococcus albus TaxID=1264 RepID=A0A1I1SB24_RUMAL|nr:SDR family oxidoreductase [Ruminococcus albus]SFD41808.1 3-oxoacyl-[acyl-carrier protein] reductase [Ruminococcus albus]